MRYLVATYREGAKPEDWAQPGEPVVPNFPTGAPNTFLGTVSFKPVPYARIVNDPALTLDAIAIRLYGRYKSLPPQLLDTYVLETAKVALLVPVGTLCTLMIDETGEVVTLVDLETQDRYELWNRQPVPQELR